MIQAIIIVFVFISGLVGAGFATGSEIYYYFARYGSIGYLGVLSSVLIFSIILYFVLSDAKKYDTYIIDDYLLKLTDKKRANIIGIISYITMFCVLVAMLSGFGEMAYTFYGIKKAYAVIFMLVLSYFIIFNGYKSFMKFQTLSAGIIISVIIGVIIYILLNTTIPVSSNMGVTSLFSGVCYSGYNLLTSVAVLCILAEKSNKNISKNASFILFFSLGILMIIMTCVILKYRDVINLGTMPLMNICVLFSKRLAVLYSVAIFFSMLTTSVSAGYTLNLKIQTYIGKKSALYIIPASALLMSGMDFSFIVDKVYRISGIISIYLMYLILKKRIKK